jgi:hypothetical protein
MTEPPSPATPTPPPAAGPTETPAAATPTPAPAARPTEAPRPATPTAAPAAGPTETPPPTAPTPPPAPAPAPAVATPKPETPQPASSAFNPDAGGRAALAAVQECFSAYERRRAGFSFGLSLLFSPETGRASKVYFPNEAELDETHVSCLSHVLRRVSAGGRPADYVAVEYRFVVKGDALRVSVVGTNP